MVKSLNNGDWDYIAAEVRAQAEAGADVIDVNVATFGVDEVITLPRVVELVMNTTNLPVCIDSPNPVALAAALKVYKGKQLINSVTGEESSMQRVLPLVKEYKAAVVGLVQDEKGIPNDAERRLAIAQRIVQRAAAIGIPCEDVVIDCVALALGADHKSGLVTFANRYLCGNRYRGWCDLSYRRRSQGSASNLGRRPHFRS